jgi:hypothetical protein
MRMTGAAVGRPQALCHVQPGLALLLVPAGSQAPDGLIACRGRSDCMPRTGLIACWLFCWCLQVRMGGTVYLDNGFEDLDFPSRKCATSSLHLPSSPCLHARLRGPRLPEPQVRHPRRRRAPPQAPSPLFISLRLPVCMQVRHPRRRRAPPHGAISSLHLPSSPCLHAGAPPSPTPRTTISARTTRPLARSARCGRHTCASRRGKGRPPACT